MGQDHWRKCVQRPAQDTSPDAIGKRASGCGGGTEGIKRGLSSHSGQPRRYLQERLARCPLRQMEQFAIHLRFSRPTVHLEKVSLSTTPVNLTHGLTLHRTHDEALGASSLRNTHFKLLDSQNEDQVLAVYIQDRKLLDKSNVARVEYFAALDPNLELLSLAAIFGIEDKIRRRSNSSAVAAASA